MRDAFSNARYIYILYANCYTLAVRFSSESKLRQHQQRAHPAHRHGAEHLRDVKHIRSA
jgi:hypothetical protein